MRRIGKVTSLEKLDCSFHIYVNVLHTYTDLYKIRKPPSISNLNTLRVPYTQYGFLSVFACL